MSEIGKRRGLGMGLSALLGQDSDPVIRPEAREPTRSLSIGQIYPGRYQPRRRFDDDKLAGLVESVREKGVLQPLLVRPHPEIPNGFELIAGERRWRAAQRAALHEVPVIIRDLSDRETLEIALVENLQREDLNPLEEADAYARLIEEFGHTQDVLAKAMGKSRSHVTNTLRLLGCSEKVRAYLRDGKITAGHARALVGYGAADDLVEEIVARGLNVRQVEAMVAGAKKPLAAAPKKLPEHDPNTVALERELTTILGLGVSIKAKGNSGVLTISYRSLDQLDGFLRRLR